MSDPAIEAAKRLGDHLKLSHRLKAIAGACEALAPIQELHRQHDHLAMCIECEGEWPCATAKLSYTTEELEP